MMRLAPFATCLVAAAGTATGLTLAGPTAAGAVSGAPVASVTVQGHGWGHGRGMGQWGALGYALAGQSYSWILDHYYGGTTMGSVPNAPIRVRMVENDGNDVIVTSASGFNGAGVQVPAGHALLMHYSGSGTTWQVSTGPGCAGPWSAAGTADEAGSSGAAAVVNPPSADPSAPSSSLLQLCMAGGNIAVRGAVAAAHAGSSARTVDVLPVESYLRGVVASESPAYWGTLGAAGAQGHPEGFQALEAQAVAARSYAVADQRSGPGGSYGYADICDTTSCQVYRGVAGENATADQAIAATAGQVRASASGAVAPTEFSASTGGWTAGGTFPAVVDDGDSVCVSSACNPNHDWTATISASEIEGAYPSIGTLTALAVVGRSGPAAADWGGRPTQVSISGTRGSVTVTGGTLAAVFGLRSDFFTVGGAPGPAPTPAPAPAPAPVPTPAPTTTTTAPPPPPPPPPTPVIPSTLVSRAVRVAGSDRVATATAASRMAYPSGGAGAVVLARADDYADALAGGPLAGADHGPLLLTGSSGLDPTVLAEVKRVLPAGRIVYVLGGTQALSPAIDSALTSNGYKVVRIEGPTRFATAVAVAHELGDPRVVFEVSGAAFPDGLSAGPAAIAQSGAILLTAGSSASSETAGYLAAHPGDQRYAVGVPATQADPSAIGVAGPDRFATSAAVAARFFPAAPVAGVATGLEFPDALAAGPALRGSGPLLLVPHTGPPPAAVAGYLTGLGSKLRSLEVFGGPAAVSY